MLFSLLFDQDMRTPSRSTWDEDDDPKSSTKSTWDVPTPGGGSSRPRSDRSDRHYRSSVRSERRNARYLILIF